MRKVIFLNSRNEGDNMKIDRQKNNLLELAKIVLYYSNKTSQKLYKTKLQKLLFYTQFLYYKLHKERLLQDNFICDHFGPVVPNLNDYLKMLSDAKIIKLQDTTYGTYIVPKIQISDDEYPKEQKEILDRILNKFDHYTASQISDYSHEETLWSCTAHKEVIDLERASELNGF